jgi:hypothetical protein
VGGQDGFGSSVTSIGDVDADGVPDVVAGADPTWSPGYAKVLSGRTGRELAVLPGEHANDRFGHTVAALGDVDGDGIPDFAVTALGAPSLDGRIPWAGRVYVFSGRDFSRIRVLGGAQSSTAFGNLVLGMEDIDGDGFAEIAVSQASWGSEVQRGVVYMFSGAPDGVEARGEPCAPGDAAGPHIGMGLPPRPGAPVAIHLSGAAPAATGLLLLGASDQQWLGVPLPLDLTPAGLPGCFLYLSPDVILVQPTDATGFATRTLAIPADPMLAGATFFAQWCVDPAPSGAPPTFTRALVCRVLPP